MNDSITSFTPDAVVIDAGIFPTDPLPLSFLDSVEKIVCCDGAANSYLALHPDKVWRIVGDCDSLSPDILRDYAAIVRRIPDQDTNDQTKAVSYLAERGIRRIAIIGATGLREDHTLGNITLLPTYLTEHHVDARIFTDFGVFIPCIDTHTFHCPKATQVSIFNFGASEIRATGLRYPLRDFDRLWQGTLNQTTDTSFTIHAKGTYMVFINYR